MDTKGILTKKIGQVLTEKQYKDIVTANTAHTDPSKIGYYADYLVGVKLPKQGNLDADDYKAGLENFCDYNQTFQERLGEQISDNVRKEHATGFIVVSFLLHRPVNIMNDPAHGDRKVTKANTGFVTWAGSIGLADSVILADQKDPDKVYYVVSHEMGHGFYLVHWENVKGDYNPSDHDQDDHNCTMSYSDSHYAQYRGTTHFKSRASTRRTSAASATWRCAAGTSWPAAWWRKRSRGRRRRQRRSRR